jgi:hypothetical protein
MASWAQGEIIRPGAAGIFHCWQRCVRRAYLLGNDPLTGRCHTHRRDWFILALVAGSAPCLAHLSFQQRRLT